MGTLKDGLYNLRKDLLENGYEIETERWQGATEHPAFIEILHATMQGQMYNDEVLASNELKDTDKYLMDEAFSHSYPERMWQDRNIQKGIRFNIANLNTAVELLSKEPTTRQCYIPIWFPEDLTAASQGERVPC